MADIKRSLTGEEFYTTAKIGSSWFESHYSPLYNGSEFVGVIGTAHDVTGHRTAEIELAQRNEELKRSDTCPMRQRAGFIISFKD